MIIEKYNYYNVRKALGHDLWQLRHKASISQRSLALKLNLTQKEIDKIELGKGSAYAAIDKLLKFYGRRVKVELIE